MRIAKLKIREKFLKGEDDSIKILSFILNKNNDIQIKKITNASMYIESVHSQDKYFPEMLEKYKKAKCKHSLKNTDILSIIRKSPYEPFSFWFIKDLFAQIFENSVVLEKFKFKRPGRTTSGKTSVAWLFRKPLMIFLEYFTNIDDVAKQFIEEIKKIEDVKFIENYGDAQYYKLLHFYIKRNKELSKEIKEYDLLPIDNKFLIVQKGKKIKSLSYRTMIYYASSFKEGSALFT